MAISSNARQILSPNTKKYLKFCAPLKQISSFFIVIDWNHLQNNLINEGATVGEAAKVSHLMLLLTLYPLLPHRATTSATTDLQSPFELPIPNQCPH